ncbi:hypothetical protein [Crocosphaera sp. XPORK-15E]|uniref:hypothetical protein n=1 Tax=Crocosphaera sp. XPORK-15E TaxID=3110247 RepID=UPI002B212680|nr:hypothetical protein [Crocosphaera sp. XPORK-15E]MEA5535703.1 hypothetical protein [Crocosphaera sp. XPORK-15E]
MMTQPFILSPRYRLDDSSPWLEGVDPSRRYWLAVNSNQQLQVVIPGLWVSSVQELKEVILQFRSLQPQEKMVIKRMISGFTIQCISSNCYAIQGRVNGALAWHLFDKEAIESLLMTGHPDWIPSPQDVELGRKLLEAAFRQPAYAI